MTISTNFAGRVGALLMALAGVAAPALAQSDPAPSPQVLKPGTSLSTPSRPQMTTPLKEGAAASAKSIATGQSSGPAVLKVRYLTDMSVPVTLMADGATFSCTGEPGNPTPVTACTAQIGSGSVDLSATYGKGSPLTPIVPRVSGKQWNGACAGTVGDTCHLTMSGSQTVGIDFYAKP